jgi:uncharacterized protein
MSRSRAAIAIMAKQPEPGKVKTRLCPPLTPREAADLYGAFLLDTVGLTSGIPEADLFIAYDPHGARDFFSCMFPCPVECIPQGMGDLGNRLSRVSRSLFCQWYRKLVIVASDTPHLPQDAIRRAFIRLNETDVVLGPCEDGGYYLIGSRVHVPALFDGIVWSSSAVLEQTIGRAEELGLTWELLQSCYDIDTTEDLLRLIVDLKNDSGGSQVICPRTKEALAALAQACMGDSGVL